MYRIIVFHCISVVHAWSGSCGYYLQVVEGRIWKHRTSDTSTILNLQGIAWHCNMFYWLSQHIIYCTYHIHFQTHLCFGKKVHLSSTHRTMIAQYSERPAVKRTTSAITTISVHLAWHKYKHVPIAIQLFQESKSSCDWWINHDEFMLPWKVLFVLVRWSSNLYLANKALIDLKLLTWDEGHLQSSDALCFNNDLATWDSTDQNG